MGGDPDSGSDTVEILEGGEASMKRGNVRTGMAIYDPNLHFTSDLSYKVFLDRYTTKDIERRFRVGDVALALVVDDNQWPRKEVARVLAVDGDELELEILTGPEKGDRIRRERAACDRPVEQRPEDMWRRVARALAQVERDEIRPIWEERFFEALSGWRFVPGGRILAGSGVGSLTLYNCVAAETLVHTRDGMKPIGSLSGAVEILSQGGVYRTAVFGSYGVQRLYRVLLENGDTIDATAGHEWIAAGPGGATEVVTTLDLAGREIPIQPPCKPALDARAVAHGIAFADGIVDEAAGGLRVDLDGGARDLLAWLEPVAGGVRRRRGGAVRAMGLPRAWQALPGDRSGASYWRGFIAGLLAVRGWVDARGDVTLALSDSTALDAVRRHASEAGFVASAVAEMRAAANAAGGAGGAGAGHTLGLYGPSVAADDLLLATQRARFARRGAREAAVRVVGVASTERVEEVFCCNEPETHTMVVGQGYLTRQCYVVPSPKDSRQGIIETLGQMIEIMSRGGGVGINVSSLRPRRAVVRGVNGRSSGAVSWMDLYSRATGLVEQGGCFGPDERIATDRGGVAAAELYERMGRGERFRALTHDGLQPITARFANGERPLFRVTTTLGYSVEVTAEHRMGVLRDGRIETVELGRLGVGSEILVVAGDDDAPALAPPGGLSRGGAVALAPAPTLRLIADAIVAIDPTRVHQVYDFEVATTHMLAAEGVYTSNSRRGALMLMLYDWHPDLLRFIDAKRTPGMVENANISVCVSDAFMQAVKEDSEWELRFPDTDDPDYDTLWNGDIDAWTAAGKAVVTYDRRPARDIWQRLTESAWASAEPGIAFLDRSNKQSNSWYFHPLIATNPCVTGDTLVYTGEGLRRADELFLAHTPVEAVVDGRMRVGRTENASPVFLTGLKPVVRVVTREGYSVRVTADHRLYSDERGWVEAKDLRRGEPVRILDHPGGFGTEGSEDLGRVLGYMSVTARRRGDTLRVSFAPERQAELEPLLTASVRRLSGAGAERGDGGVALRKGRGAAMVAQQLGEIAFAYGLGAPAPAVPDAVARGSEAMQRGYLQALFEAAGQLATARGRPMLTARGPAGLLRGVQQVLLNMGMVSHLRTAKGRELDDQVPSLLRVEREGLLRFGAAVGALSASRRGALADAVAELRRHPLTPERHVAHVERIVPDGEEAVYDLTEPESHSFVAGGLVVHNCAEQPLPAWGVCCLGHVNLNAFVQDGELDWDGLGRTVRAAVRFLDNVVDTTPYYFEENEETQKGERRLGLGTMGLGEVLIRLGLRYGSPEAVDLIDRIYAFVAHEAYAASADLAQEKGPFPYFDAEKFLQSGFMQGMSEDIRERVRSQGMRNVTLLTQAPTGCVAPDTLVRANGALVAMASLGDPTGEQWQEIEADVETDGSSARASHFYINGDRPVATLRTRNGYEITATLNHRVRVIDVSGAYVWRQVGEVQPGDLAVLRRGGLAGGEGVALRPVSAGRGAVARLPERMTADLAEIVGYLMGGGGRWRRGGVRLAVGRQDADVRDHLQGRLAKLFRNHHVAIEERPDGWQLSLGGDPVARFFEANGLATDGGRPGEGAAGAVIPAAVLESGADAVAAFLRGLFEADPAATRYNVGVVTVSAVLARQVQQALLGLGILAAVRTVPDVTGEPARASRHEVRVLNGREAARFCERIGFIGERKRARAGDGGVDRDWPQAVVSGPLGAALRQDIALRRTNGALDAEDVRALAARHPQLAATRLARMLAEGLFLEVVETVTLGRSPTYDLTVPENHTYVANGFVCHNTVGTMVGTSTGIEPFYALKYMRQSRLGMDEQYVTVAEEWLKAHPGDVLPAHFVGAMDLSPDEHVRVQAAVQRWTDSSISKTANAPADYTVEDTRRLYELAYDLGCKGVTIYRDQSRQTQVLHRTDDKAGKAEAVAEGAPAEAAPAAPAPVVDAAPTLARRPRRMRGECFLVPTHFGNLTLDVHEDPSTGEPVEIIASAGTAGSDLMADAVALGMAASVLLRMKGPVSKRERLEILIEKFRNIGGAKNGGAGLGAAASLAQGIARGLEQYLESADDGSLPARVGPTLEVATAHADGVAASGPRGNADFDLCPSCGAYSMEMVEGCRTCHACGFSNCS